MSIANKWPPKKDVDALAFGEETELEIERPSFSSRSLALDSDHVRRSVDDYCMRTMQSNAQHGALPFFLATLSFAALFATIGSKFNLFLWLASVTCVSVLRLFFISKYWNSNDRSDRLWMWGNVALLGLLGSLFGITPFIFPASDEIWLLAVSNLWLAGLVVAVLLSQGIVVTAGLAFALPAIVPLFCLLLFSGDPTLTLMGLGNVLLFTYFYSVISRSRVATLEEARHRVMYEHLAHYYDDQCRRSDELVEDLTNEIERRKEAEIALRESRDAAEAISNIDELTKLANRRVFDRVLSREWSRALRSAKPVSLIVCEIDSLRAYNDHYGSRASDQCVARIGRIIGANTRRASDLAARYSNEQFSILLPDVCSDAALDMAEAIRHEIFELTILHPGALVGKVVTASFGVATIVPNHPGMQHSLVEIADYGLNRAIRGGGNCVFASGHDVVGNEK